MLVAHPYYRKDSDVLIILQAPTKNDEEAGIPLRGSTGVQLHQLFAQCNYDLANATVMYAWPTPISPYSVPGKNHPAFPNKKAAGHIINDTPVSIDYTLHATMLKNALMRTNYKVIIAFGDIPSMVFALNRSSDKMRGSMLTYANQKIVIARDPRLLNTNPEVSHAMRADISRALNWGLKNDPPDLAPKYNFILEPTFDQVLDNINAMLHRAASGPLHLGVDIETVGPLISCLGYAWSNTDAICIPFMRELSPDNPSYFDPEQELTVVKKLRELLTHPNVEVTGQNFNYDNQYIARNWGFLSNITCDSMLAYHTCFSSDTPKGLDYLSSLFATHYYYWKDESRHRGKGIDDRTHWEYNCKDCVYTYELRAPLEDFVEKFNLKEQYQFQMQMGAHALRPMLRGIRWDKQLQAELSMEVSFQLGKMRQQLDYIIHPDVWQKKSAKDKSYYESPAKFKTLLYEVLRLPVQKDKKTKRPSTSDAALKELMKIDPILKPWLQLVLDYRSLALFRNNYLSAKTDYDKRMRTNYNPAGTSTYRFASAKDAFGYGLNLQNISAGK